MISSIVFINHKGEILIYRVYKDDITRSETTQFCAKIVATKENKESPKIYIDGIKILIYLYNRNLIHSYYCKGYCDTGYY